MKKSKELKEQRGLLDTELRALNAKVTAKTDLTEAEELRFEELVGLLTALNSEIDKAEARELAIEEAEKRALPATAPGGFAIVKPTDNEDQVKPMFRFGELILKLSDKRQIEGLYKEMNEEGRRDLKDSGVKQDVSDMEYVVPSFIIGNEKRDLASPTTGSGGGYTIATELLANEWIDNLKDALVVMKMGAKFLTGLRGNIAIPRKTNNSGATWLTETGTITPADFTFDQVAMSPKRLGNATAFSRQLLIQSSLDIERLVREDLVMSQALALQAAIIHGPATGNGPTGILNISGIGAVAIGTNGGPLTWAKLVALESEVAFDNALMGNLSYLTNAKVRGAAKGIVRDAGSGLFLWGESFAGQGESTPFNGYPVWITSAVPSTNVKGSSGAVLSWLIFGNWADLIIGQWGGLILTANPYSLDLSGQIRVVCNAFYDVDIRHAESFAAIPDITT